MINLLHEIWVGSQEGLGRLTALAKPLALVCEPGSGLVDNLVLDRHVEHRALLGNARAVHDVELSRLERRSYLVLDDLDPHTVANDLAIDLDAVHAPDVHAHGREELERAATGRGLGVTKHDADLLAQLVDEDAGGV